MAFAYTFSQKTLQHAYEDVAAFLVYALSAEQRALEENKLEENKLEENNTKAILDEAIIELRCLAPAISMPADAVQQVDAVLDYLESHMYADPATTPWVLDESVPRKRSLPQKTSLRKLLTGIRSVLDGLVPAGLNGPVAGPFTINDFVEFVIGRIAPGSEIAIGGAAPIPDLGKRRTNFVSWLFYSKSESHFYILMNEEQALLQPDGQAIWPRRRDFCILHELGHAREQLEQFEANPSGWASKPCHETQGWAYARGVVTCISSARARVDRLLFDGEGEWRI